MLAKLHQREQIVLAARDQAKERRILLGIAGGSIAGSSAVGWFEERFHQAAFLRHANASSSVSVRVRKPFKFMRSKTARTSNDASAQMSSRPASRRSSVVERSTPIPLEVMKEVPARFTIRCFSWAAASWHCASS